MNKKESTGQKRNIKAVIPNTRRKVKKSNPYFSKGKKNSTCKKTPY